MTEQERQQVFDTKRLKLSRSETLTHYSVLLFLLFISFLSLPDLYRFYLTDTYTGLRSGTELLSDSLPWFILAIIFYFIQRRRLQFREFEIAQTVEDFSEALKRTVIELEWTIDEHNQHFVKATRTWNWTGSWGEMITIIRDDKKILINSICDPKSISSVASYGCNKRNIKSFINNLQDVKKGVEQVLIDGDAMVINEWTLKKTLIRILFYPFCIFLICVAILKCIPKGEIFLAFGGLSLGGAYLYWDIQALLLNKRLKDKARKQ
jgi:hypothetical protein